MARAYASIILKVPVETVWSLVRDFNGLPSGLRVSAWRRSPPDGRLV
jgi:hypothetical protein